jgi:hypothetical protein
LKSYFRVIRRLLFLSAEIVEATSNLSSTRLDLYSNAP